MLISHNPIIGYQVAIAMNMHMICKSNPGADEIVAVDSLTSRTQPKSN